MSVLPSVTLPQATNMKYSGVFDTTIFCVVITINSYEFEPGVVAVPASIAA
jgi:hypothetical protein